MVYRSDGFPVSRQHLIHPENYHLSCHSLQDLNTPLCLLPWDIYWARLWWLSAVLSQWIHRACTIKQKQSGDFLATNMYTCVHICTLKTLALLVCWLSVVNIVTACPHTKHGDSRWVEKNQGHFCLPLFITCMHGGFIAMLHWQWIHTGRCPSQLVPGCHIHLPGTFIFSTQVFI